MTALEKIGSIVVLALILSSLLVTSVMAFSRWAQIVYPFRKITIRGVTAFLIGGLFVPVCLQVYSLFISSRHAVWLVQIMAAWTDNAFSPHVKIQNQCRLLQITLVFSVPFLFQIFGLVASVLTIREIAKRHVVVTGANHGRHGQATVRGTLKIIATNCGSLLFVICHITTFIVQLKSTKTILNDHDITVNSFHEAWMNFSFGYILPIALSALNPVIFLCFTPKALRYFPWSKQLGLWKESEEFSMKLRTRTTPVQKIRHKAKISGTQISPSLMAMSPVSIYYRKTCV